MRAPTVLYAVTDPMTALAFLGGQLKFVHDAGFEVHLACGVTSELEELARNEGVTLHDVPMSRGWARRGELGALARAVRLLKELRPDVLNYSTPKASLVWAVASWFARPKRVVFLLRGLRLEGERPRRPAFWILWLMELIAARSADTVVCVSPSLRDRARRLRLASPHKLLIIGAGSSNGVDTTRFVEISDLERANSRRERNIPESSFVIGFVGRMVRDKGIHVLLDALEQHLSDLEVTCLLVGPAESTFDLDGALASRPRAATVARWRPATSTVERELAAMDLFVLPSFREGMSNALLEAQARGLPCVTTDATGCHDAIEPGVSGLVVPTGDPEALARAIREIAASRGLGTEMGRRGRARVEALFRPQDVWAGYVRLYGGNEKRSVKLQSDQEIR